VSVVDFDVVFFICDYYSCVVVFYLEEPGVEPSDVEVAGDDVFWAGWVDHFGLLV